MTTYIAALDQGTTSSRCIIFDGGGKIVASGQREHEQIYPKPGWVEHDATEIRFRISQVIDTAVHNAGIRASDVAALGITNQRETAVVWEKATGNPIHGAIVWQDTRTDRLCKQLAAEDAKGDDRFRDQTGLPLATYFAGPKWRWILDHVDGARERAEAGELLCGTMDTWALWNLTGGPDGGVHATDVTNASRTMLMDLTTLQWDDGLCEAIGVPRAALPQIRSSSEPYGEVKGGSLAGVQVAGILGDQQAATFGQVCFSPGEAKNTYGTGNFLLLNTGTTPQWSEHGLLTTVGYKLGEEDAVYCLEGSIAVTGSLVQWVRDNVGLIKDAASIETLAKSVDDNGGVYIVPAFSGLFAPYWRSEARGAILGLTRFVRAGHLARAVLEATAFQSREVTDAMNEDSGVPLESLRVDGGMVVNETLMQFQADVLGVPVIRPEIIETTALGAAYAAGLAVGVWGGTDELRALWAEDKRWEPSMDPKVRDRSYRFWKKAVTRTFDWVEEDDED